MRLIGSNTINLIETCWFVTSFIDLGLAQLIPGFFFLVPYFSACNSGQIWNMVLTEIKTEEKKQKQTILIKPPCKCTLKDKNLIPCINMDKSGCILNIFGASNSKFYSNNLIISNNYPADSALKIGVNKRCLKNIFHFKSCVCR